ncbi:hypothetical protein KI387_027512, partial [Taxus chinensis]
MMLSPCTWSDYSKVILLGDFSYEAMTLISHYGAYFIEFRKLSDIRLAGYEGAPLRLPMFCNDKMSLIE